MRASFILAAGAIIGLAGIGLAGIAPAQAQISKLPAEIAAKVAAMGPTMGPSVVKDTFDLFRPLVPTGDAGIKLTSNLAYGPDERNRLDIYQPTDPAPAGAKGRPVLIFVHGGGFVGGDKAFDGTFYGNIGRFFARAGIVAVLPTYRLAPQRPWPAGTEDVAAAVGWTRANIAGFGGDPDRIIVSGQSAGATHAAAYLFDAKLGPKAGEGVIGGILGSGFYEMTAEDKGPGNRAYYGSDASLYADRSPINHVGDSKLPLFLYTAEYDPPFLAVPTYVLAAKACVRDGKCPEFHWLPGENHISEVAAFGTTDSALGEAMVAWIKGLK